MELNLLIHIIVVGSIILFFLFRSWNKIPEPSDNFNNLILFGLSIGCYFVLAAVIMKDIVHILYLFFTVFIGSLIYWVAGSIMALLRIKISGNTKTLYNLIILLIIPVALLAFWLIAGSKLGGKIGG